MSCKGIKSREKFVSVVIGFGFLVVIETNFVLGNLEPSFHQVPRSHKLWIMILLQTFPRRTSLSQRLENTISDVIRAI